jgi:iron complex transport system substrate-binding protein
MLDAMRPHRIVSLLPAATELVAALGAGNRLVGRSHACDRPAAVGGLPALTRPTVDAAAPSAAIDAQVRARDPAADALSFFAVDHDRLATLAPELIVTQTQCAVCAVTPEAVAQAASAAAGRPVEVVSLDGRDLDGVFHDIRRLAGALSAPASGEALIADMRRRITRAGARAAAARGTARPPRLMVLEWLDPPMTGGHWTPDLVAGAGALPVPATPGDKSGRIDLAAIAEAEPDILVLAPCGFGLERGAAELPALADRPDWQDLPAVRAGRVALADGDRHFNRPGPGLAETVEVLAEIQAALWSQAADDGGDAPGDPDAAPAARWAGQAWRRV